MVAGHTVVMSTTFTVMDVTPSHGSRSHSGHVHDLHSEDLSPPHGSRSHRGHVDNLHRNGPDTSTW